MTILLASGLGEPHFVGGAERVISNLAEGLGRMGLEICTLATAPSQAAVDGGEGGRHIRVPHLNLYWHGDALKRAAPLRLAWHALDLWNPRSFYVLREVLRKVRPKVVHSHNLAGLSPALWSAARSLDIPVVHHLHDYSLLCPRTTLVRTDGSACTNLPLPCKLRQGTHGVLSKGVAAVISPSKFVLDRHQESGLFRDTPSWVIPNAISTTSGFRYKRKRTTNRLTAVYLGQLSDHKGVRCLLTAMARLGENVQLHVGGTGPLESFVAEQAAILGNVTYHGFVNGDLKDSLLSQADVLIAPSTWAENSPIVIYEAFQYGLPVVATAVGGVTELIGHEVNGLLVPPNDVSALADALRRLERDFALVAQLDAGVVQLRHKFTIESMCRSVADVYIAVTQGEPR